MSDGRFDQIEKVRDGEARYVPQQGSLVLEYVQLQGPGRIKLLCVGVRVLCSETAWYGHMHPVDCPIAVWVRCLVEDAEEDTRVIFTFRKEWKP